MQQEPNHRLHAVKTAMSNGRDLEEPREQALATMLNGKECPLDSVRRAADIYSNVYKQEVIESLLLAGCKSEEVEIVVKVPKEVTDAYAYLFFDTTVFEDDLDRIAYAEGYSKSKQGAELKKYAVNVGKDSLMVRLSRGQYVVAVDTAHSSVRNTAYMLSQLAKVNPTKSEITKEAFRWAQLCLRSAETAPDGDRGNPIVDLHIRIESVDEVKSAETSGLAPEDIARGK